jgi:hypothetical protein
LPIFCKNPEKRTGASVSCAEVEPGPLTQEKEAGTIKKEMFDRSGTAAVIYCPEG